MSKRVIIMVGAPGSGKSTRISHYVKDDAVVVSADHYFEQSGTYIFDRSKLGQAHKFSQDRFTDALLNKMEPVIVDNTNTTAKERKFYIDLAKVHGYEVWIDAIECDAQTCFQRNVHGVPLEAIERMIARIDVPYGFYPLSMVEAECPSS